MKSKSALAVTLALASACVYAGDGKTPYYIDGQAQSSDFRSQQFFFEVKEQFRSSTTLRVVDSENDSINRIRIVSIDIDGRDAIAYSVAWLMNGPKETAGLELYMSHQIGICPASELQSCARSLLAKADKKREEESKLWGDAVKSLLKK